MKAINTKISAEANIAQLVEHPAVSPKGQDSIPVTIRKVISLVGSHEGHPAYKIILQLQQNSV
jgi:hypothetical protein